MRLNPRRASIGMRFGSPCCRYATCERRLILAAHHDLPVLRRGVREPPRERVQRHPTAHQHLAAPACDLQPDAAASHRRWAYCAATAERCPRPIIRVTSAADVTSARRPTVSTIIRHHLDDREPCRVSLPHHLADRVDHHRIWFVVRRRSAAPPCSTQSRPCSAARSIARVARRAHRHLEPRLQAWTPETVSPWSGRGGHPHRGGRCREMQHAAQPRWIAAARAVRQRAHRVARRRTFVLSTFSRSSGSRSSR